MGETPPETLDDGGGGTRGVRCQVSGVKPFDGHDGFDGLKFGIARENDSVFLNGGGDYKSIRVRNGMVGFDVGGIQDKIAGRVQKSNWHTFDQGLYTLCCSKAATTLDCVKHFAEVNHA